MQMYGKPHANPQKNGIKLNPMTFKLPQPATSTSGLRQERQVGSPLVQGQLHGIATEPADDQRRMALLINHKQELNLSKQTTVRQPCSKSIWSCLKKKTPGIRLFHRSPMDLIDLLHRNGRVKPANHHSYWLASDC